MTITIIVSVKLKKRMNPIYNTPILNNITFPRIQFRSNSAAYPEMFEPLKDSFSTNPLYDNCWDKNFITKSAKSNSEVMRILKENRIPLKVNFVELDKLKRGHLMDTRVTAAKIYSALPKEIKSEINPQDIQQAAMLHDYGKVLIPDEILNKNGKLTDEEKKIMSLHSELGYELLKQQGVKENVLNLVKYHHQTSDGSGYPALDNNYTPDISSQILMAADKYSALKEKRSYKDAMTRDEALEVLRQDVADGLLSEEVYKALEKAV